MLAYVIFLLYLCSRKGSKSMDEYRFISINILNMLAAAEMSLLFNMFMPKSYTKICSFQKIVVSLHSVSKFPDLSHIYSQIRLA